MVWSGVDLLGSTAAGFGLGASVSDPRSRGIALSMTNLLFSLTSFGVGSILWGGNAYARAAGGVEDVAGLRWASVALFAVSAFTTGAALATARLDNGKADGNATAVASLYALTTFTQFIALVLMAVDTLIVGYRAG